MPPSGQSYGQGEEGIGLPRDWHKSSICQLIVQERGEIPTTPAVSAHVIISTADLPILELARLAPVDAEYTAAKAEWRQERSCCGQKQYVAGVMMRWDLHMATVSNCRRSDWVQWQKLVRSAGRGGERGKK